MNEEDQVPVQLRSYSKKKEAMLHVPSINEIQGVNSSVGLYNICTSGSGEELCKLNFSQMPG
jgi:hypothetical protein